MTATTVFAQSADTYPVKPVRVIVGLAPGGGTDIIARLLTQKMSDNLKRSFIVENRTGAGGTVAYATVAKSAPDGYTLLAVASGYSITPAVYPKLSYDPIKDFTPISVVVQAPIVLMSHPALPARSVKDLLALARSPRAHLDAASAGHGTSNHLALELFNSLAGVKIAHVPYKGTGQALTDLLGNQIQVYWATMPPTLPHVRSGRLKGLAVGSLKRTKAAPELPTVSELGYPGFEAGSWFGMLAPAGTPKSVVARLNKEVVAALAAPELNERLSAEGAEPAANTPEEFAAFIKNELVKWAKVTKAARIAAQ